MTKVIALHTIPFVPKGISRDGVWAGIVPRPWELLCNNIPNKLGGMTRSNCLISGA